MKIFFVLISIFFLFICTREVISSPAITKTVKDYLTEAEAYFAQGKYPEALEVYQKAYRISSDNARVHSGIGLVLDSLGQHEPAQKFCESGFVFDPDDKEGYFRLGVVLANVGKFDRALENFLKVINLDPYYPEAHFNAGVCYWHKKQYARAVSAYQKFFAVHPGLETSRYILGSFEIDRSNYAPEIGICLETIETKNADVKTYGSLGVAYGHIGQYAKSIEYLLRAVHISPNYAKGLYNLAVSYQRMNDFNQAKAYYQRAILLEPRYSFVFKAGLLDKSRGQYDREISCSQRSMIPLVYVGFAEAYYNLGRIYCLQKEWNGFQQQIEELEKLSRFDLVEDLNECRQKK